MIRERLKNGILIGDGAMGTMLQARGAAAGELPEMLNLTKPELVRGVHEAYFAAGSDYVATNTFGANALRLAATGHSVAEVVRAAARLARTAAGDTGAVALDIGPLGKLLRPMGDMEMEAAYRLFREQVVAGAAAGADLILLETFTDVLEAKAAVLAAKENSDLPVFCSLTFQEDGRMLTGTDPMTAVHILQDMGIDAIGVNCSLGPDQITPVALEMLRHARIPLIVQPNAGLPREENGKAVYDVHIEEFLTAMKELLTAGVRVAGGCCGTTPDYIRAVRVFVDGPGGRSAGAKRRGTAEGGPAACPLPSACSALRTTLFDGRVRVVGERLNPTGKKRLKQALIERDYDYIEDEAIRQAQAGADVLNVNMGLPEIDERALLLGSVARLEGLGVPLMIDCTDAAVMEAAVRSCRGKPIINSVNGEQKRMDDIFPIVQKYGTAVVALLLDENGLPGSVKARMKILDRILVEAEKYGIGRDRVIVDCLTLTVSAQQDACVDTLEAIRLVRKDLGMHTTLGVSNISFGLPARSLLNRSFLAMAMLAGLDAPILDPTNQAYMDTVRSGEVLLGKDRDAETYIAYARDRTAAEGEKTGGGASGGSSAGGGISGGGPPAGGGTPNGGAPATGSLFATGGAAAGGETADIRTAAGRHGYTTGAWPPTAEAEISLEEIIRRGFESRSSAAAEKLLARLRPIEIIEQAVLPALERVGRDYETGEIFLPQMIKSAETAKNAFEVLRRVMRAQGETISYGKIILATVKDDIHDIGKNIVKAIMENYGYEIVDLGKDVPPETVAQAARAQKIRMVGLSALMTTTVVNMEKTIRLLKEKQPDCITLVGGAVLNAAYAKKIGADHYCRNAMDAVRVANAVFKGDEKPIA